MIHDILNSFSTFSIKVKRTLVHFNIQALYYMKAYQTNNIIYSWICASKGKINIHGFEFTNRVL
jgi:hypothetical protein